MPDLKLNLENLMVKGIVTQLPEKDQLEVTKCYDALKALVDAYGTNGLVALALIGTELAE